METVERIKNTLLTLYPVRKTTGQKAMFREWLVKELKHDGYRVREERYGKTVTLTFGLDLYAAPGTDPTALEQTWAALAQACLPPGPKGLAPGAFSCGETDYDQQARLLKRPAQLVCTALLVFSNTQEQGEFLDFEIRGERTL